MQNNQRYEGTITINAPEGKQREVVSMLLGRFGSNIRRIIETVGNKTFIKLYNSKKGNSYMWGEPEECDKIFISSQTEQSLRRAAKMLKDDMNAVLYGTKSSKFESVVKVDKEAVGTIIGKRGYRLRQIMNTVGKGCFIIFKKELEGFLVTVESEEQLKTANDEILKQETQYFTKKSQHINSDTQERTMENNRSTLFKGQSYKSRYHNLKNLEREKWAIRQELSELRNSNGELVYPSYFVKDHKTGRKKHLVGVYAVPWAAVNEVMKRNDAVKEDEELMAAAGLAKQRVKEQQASLNEMSSWESVSEDTKSEPVRGVWASGVSKKVLSKAL